MTEYLINMDDGRLVWRNSETDKQINLRPVSNEIVEMLHRGEVTAKDVINAISMKLKENGEFNLPDYIEGLKRLNVRRSNPQGAPVREELKDRTDEEVSASDVKAAREKTDAKAERKARAKRVNDALDAQD